MNRFNFLVNIDKYLHFIKHNVLFLMTGDYDLHINFTTEHNSYHLIIPGNWDIIVLYEFDNNKNLLNVIKADVNDNKECNKIISVIKNAYDVGIKYDVMKLEVD